METENGADSSWRLFPNGSSSQGEDAYAKVCCDERWEEAYCRFETAVQEIAKFRRRLLKLGARSWPRDAEIVELFCGRGNGLRALHGLGFTRLEGVDLSGSLLGQAEAFVSCYLGDCRELQFDDGSKDIVLVQGGLHHLPELPDDLERTVAGIVRVLRPGGRFVLVEPWPTPFLRFVHAMAGNPTVRRLWPKLDALAVMIDRERPTYEAWLGQPQRILSILHSSFDVERMSIGWGKLMFVGRTRPS